MIIIRVPFRVPLGGGGTDLPGYSSVYGGSLVTASINKYMYVSINEPATSDKIKLYYKFSEIVTDISSITHNIIRESLKLHNIDSAIEIGSMADIEAGTGMGSSSAFTVGLLAGLNALKRNFISPIDLAEEACKVEIDLVKKPIGKQDQYAVAVGGINKMDIDTSGSVSIHPLKISQDTLIELESRLMMFYTGITRDANEVLSAPKDTDSMHTIKKIGEDIAKALMNGDIDTFGDLLHRHWETKRRLNDKMSNDQINEWYNLAMFNGALGGKIMGAGGGGFLLLCVKERNRRSVRMALENQRLRFMDFRFEFEGVKILVNVQ